MENDLTSLKQRHEPPDSDGRIASTQIRVKVNTFDSSPIPSRLFEQSSHKTLKMLIQTNPTSSDEDIALVDASPNLKEAVDDENVMDEMDLSDEVEELPRKSGDVKLDELFATDDEDDEFGSSAPTAITNGNGGHSSPPAAPM